jgi:CDP-diacylglycerol--glycerol-3-phosphate 3-phosphatidyltransferase
MTIANRITVVRCALPFVLIPALLSGVPRGKLIAFCIFIVGALSDWLDGVIARRTGTVTDFGRLMDPLADKMLVTAALASLVVLSPPLLKAWMVVVIISRDFAVTGLRLLALQQRAVLGADRTGKHKTAWQMIAIFAALLYYAAVESGLPLGPADAVVQLSIRLLFYAVTALTVVSGLLYLWRHRELYLKDA